MTENNTQSVVEYNVIKDAQDHFTLRIKKNGEKFDGSGPLNNNSDQEEFYAAVKSVLAEHTAKGEQYIAHNFRQETI
jgi:hypothetical protein